MITFHVICGSLINITFGLGGKMVHILLSLVQVQEGRYKRTYNFRS